MDQTTLKQLIEHLHIQPQRRKPLNNNFIISFLKSLKFFKQMAQSDSEQHINKYISLLSYYLRYETIDPETPLKFKHNSFIIVLTGCIRRVEYEREPAVAARLLQQKINEHRDKMYWKKDLMMFFLRKVYEIIPGDVFMADKTCELISSAPTSILYITPEKLRDAEILSSKSMRDETNFLKNTIFWNKFDIEELKQLVISCSHIIYKSGQYVYRESDPVDCVYLVRDGQFVYERKVELGRKRKEQEQVQISKLVKGEVFGYNQILQRKGKRMYSLKCCALTGQLYVFSLEYWDFLYMIFRKEFQNLHMKCVNFRQNEAIRRVKSIQDNRLRAIKTSQADRMLLRKNNSVLDYYTESQGSTSNTKKLQTQNPELPRLKRNQSIRCYSPEKLERTYFNEYKRLKKKKDNCFYYKQKQQKTLKLLQSRRKQVSSRIQKRILLDFLNLS